MTRPLDLAGDEERPVCLHLRTDLRIDDDVAGADAVADHRLGFTYGLAIDVDRAEHRQGNSAGVIDTIIAVHRVEADHDHAARAEERATGHAIEREVLVQFELGTVERGFGRVGETRYRRVVIEAGERFDGPVDLFVEHRGRQMLL